MRFASGVALAPQQLAVLGAFCRLGRRFPGLIPFLIQLAYRGERLHICPQHLPVLIHDPQRLVGLLAGAEGLEPAEHHD